MKTTHRWVDPFAEMSDEEFDAHVDELFAARPATVSVSLRIAPELLSRVRRQAGRAGVPYQTFVKGYRRGGRVPPGARELGIAAIRARRKAAKDGQALTS